MIKRLYKRIILQKWTYAILWRVIRKRTVYPFHDVPYTALRFIRFAFFCTLKNEVLEHHKDKHIVYDLGNVTTHLINEELNIRKLRKQHHNNQGNMK